MLDSTTIYLMLAMGGFLIVAVIVIHQHNCSDQIRMKRSEVKSVSENLQRKIDFLEQEVGDLQLKIDEIDEQITLLDS